MRKTVKSLTSNPLISNSFILISGGLLANLFNFLFNLLMSRNLRIEDYGSLISLVSLVTLLSIPAGALTPTVVTVAGKYFVDGNLAALHAFYMKFFKFLIVVGIGLVVVFIVLSAPLSDFFNISESGLMLASAFAVCIGYLITLNNSFLQAKLAFRSLSVINTVSAVVKVVAGVPLVLIGFGLGGAFFGVLLAFIVPLIVGFILLRKVTFFSSEKLPPISYKELLEYGVPSSIVIFCLNAFMSTDILLAKHLFNQEQAGLYAGMSLIGRVVFFVTAPISTVMFPTIINRYAKKLTYKHILYTSLLLVGSVSVGISIFYFLFSDFAVLFFLKKEEYLPIAQYIGMFSVFATLYSLLSVLAYYFLSLKKTSIYKLFLAGAIVQALLIYLIHGSFSDVITISSIVVGTILVILLVMVKYKT